MVAGACVVAVSMRRCDGLVPGANFISMEADWICCVPVGLLVRMSTGLPVSFMDCG